MQHKKCLKGIYPSLSLHWLFFTKTDFMVYKYSKNMSDDINDILYIQGEP